MFAFWRMKPPKLTTQLKDDLSETVGEPVHLFDGSDAPWNRKSPQYHCFVTDGPYLFRSKSGKLFIIWSSFGTRGYTTGVAVSGSGKTARAVDTAGPASICG
jgi:arabinan endo-1,5-alpha-L-arabinosidase